MTEKDQNDKPAERGPLERAERLNDALLMETHRQCPAISKRTGERCKRFCAMGQKTCRWHGSATRKSKTAAAKRIAQASGYAADMLVEFMADPDVTVDLRTRIAQDLLNRAGVSEKTVLQIGVEQPKSFADWVGEAIIDVESGDLDPDVILAEVIEDDVTPLVPRDELQTRHDRNAFAEVERAAQAQARERRPGGMSDADRGRIEAEALGLAPRRERSRRVARSDDAQAMAEQQDAEDAVLRRVKAAERRRNEDRRSTRRARTSEAEISQPRRRGER
jgi:hypothetical protein